MAYVQASHKLDMTNIDLNFYVRHFYQDRFLNNADHQFGGVSYEDVYLINGWSGSQDLVLGLGGYGIRLDGAGQVLGGTITGATEMTSGGVELWRIEGASVSAKKMVDAAYSRSNRDDIAILESLLSGNDVIKLSSYDDRISSGGGNDKVFGGRGNDTITGGAGKDTLLGDGGRDNLSGGSGKDLLKGGRGNDILSGDKGNDTLTGGKGADGFAFRKGDGDDTITDFQAGVDVIGIGKGASHFRQLDISRDGGDTVIEFSNVSIRLEDVKPRELDADDFLF